jgi:hypothetical protein
MTVFSDIYKIKIGPTCIISTALLIVIINSDSSSSSFDWKMLNIPAIAMKAILDVVDCLNWLLLFVTTKLLVLMWLVHFMQKEFNPVSPSVEFCKRLKTLFWCTLLYLLLLVIFICLWTLKIIFLKETDILFKLFDAMILFLVDNKTCSIQIWFRMFSLETNFFHFTDNFLSSATLNTHLKLQTVGLHRKEKVKEFTEWVTRFLSTFFSSIFN